MNTNSPVRAKCPSCGYVNELTARYLDATGAKEGTPLVVTCDCDDGGGCGQWFVITISFSATVNVYELQEAE